MSGIYEAYRQKLTALAETEFKEFTGKLNPGIENILGVRVPAVRALAKELARDDWRSYFSRNKDIYFEETLLQGLTICALREDTGTILAETRRFIPKINGWAVCDSFCADLKKAKKEPDIFWELVREYASSGEAFDIRFALVMANFHFINDERIDEILSILGSIEHEHYYVKMAVAWVTSTCFVKQRDKTFEFLTNCKLDKFTFNKAIQKTCESFRVSAEDKALLRELKAGRGD